MQVRFETELVLEMTHFSTGMAAGKSRPMRLSSSFKISIGNQLIRFIDPLSEI